MRGYRIAFIVALAANLLLALVLARVWRRSRAGGAPLADLPAPVPYGTGPAQAGPPAASVAPSTEARLAPVQLTAQRLQQIGVKTGQVEFKPVTNELRTVGSVETDERRLAYVQLRFAGWIQKVFVDASFQYVQKGQPLFTVYSPDLVTTEREYLLARQNQKLLGQSSVPGVSGGATSLVASAEERLKQWGVPPREIERLEATGEVRQELEIDSPASGYVLDRQALPNLYAQPETRLYTLADLSTVWVQAQVFQNEVGQLRPGSPAVVKVDAYPGRTFDGRVDYLYPQVDMATRTARVRLVFANPEGKLMPGMFVNVTFLIPLGRQLAIPASGVFQSGTRNVVFVDHGGGYLEPREVELGPRAGDELIVLKGLKAGESIVTSANFLIDSESQLQAALGSYAPPPPGAGAAAAMNAPAAAATVEFSTDPSPPRKGSNTFRVKLKDSSGSSITGAQVTVTFFMPAMPAMGMAAMRAVITLNDKGDGVYEGSGKLESGGTWQVSIVAQKNGQTLASKQLSVNAEGGM